MTFPVSGVLDSFNAGASQLLTTRAGWSPSIPVFGGSDMITDSVPTYASSNSIALGTAAWLLSATDIEVWATFSVVGTSGPSLMSRMTQLGTINMARYQVQYTVGTTNLRLISVINNVASANLLSITQTVSNGDSIGLSSYGNNHAIWYKAGAGVWQMLGAVWDNAIPTAGLAIGVQVHQSGRCDQFGGGALDVTTGAGGLGARGYSGRYQKVKA